MGRRGAKGYNITSLPYRVKVYINNQVLVPAQLVRALGLTRARYARVRIRKVNNGEVIELPRVKLLRTRHTDSRQFTIPKEIREKYGIKPGDEVEVLEIERVKTVEESSNDNTKLITPTLM
ncbi:MAG: AbrB/MazE/SpoVT family DNA-binding domain-containing protein [Thermoprotei archaeon]|nr:MAG: AbrB/MazE/SpoVT family DNA-binding domain-containing protein [Thermoprotei archaeon]